MKSMNKSLSIFINILVYIIALMAVGYTWQLLPDSPVLIKLYMADALGTIVVFIFSRIFDNSSMYDPYWSVQPFVMAVFLAWPLRGLDILETIVLFLVLIYGLRLTLNFYRDWSGIGHEDWRYQDFRRAFPRMY